VNNTTSAIILQDLSGNLLLAPHGIDRHQTALQIEKIEQPGHRRDIVGLFGHLDLAQHHTILLELRIFKFFLTSRT